MPNRSAKLKTLVKICGLRSIDDAMRAAELGADAAGFVVAPGSPRHISFQDSLAIAQHVLARVTPVLVLRHWSDVPPQELRLWPGPVQVYLTNCKNARMNSSQRCLLMPQTLARAKAGIGNVRNRLGHLNFH